MRCRRDIGILPLHSVVEGAVRCFAKGESGMSNRYFKDFWIEAKNGERLYLALVRNQDTGLLRYQSLGKGSNKKIDGGETTDPQEAVRWFLDGESLRFGNENTQANRFQIDGGNVLGFGMTPDLWLRIYKI